MDGEEGAGCAEEGDDVGAAGDGGEVEGREGGGDVGEGGRGEDGGGGVDCFQGRHGVLRHGLDVVLFKKGKIFCGSSEMGDAEVVDEFGHSEIALAVDERTER